MTFATFVPPEQYRYHFLQLKKNQQRFYSLILKGLLVQASSIPVDGCHQHDIQVVFQALTLDIPELYFVKSIQLKSSISYSKSTVYPEYRFDQRVIGEIQDALHQHYTGFIQSLGGLSDIEKAKKIHDHLASQVSYQDSNASYSHEAPGALLYNIGVCEGISKAFKYLADRADLKTIVVTGIEENTKEAHAWNLVEIDGNFTHIDVTFDSTISPPGCMRYDYFLLSDDEIREDHSWTTHLPSCQWGFHYYHKKGLYFESRTALITHIDNQKDCPKSFVFQTSKFSANRDVVQETLINVLSNRHFDGVTGFRIDSNFARMIFRVQYS